MQLCKLYCHFIQVFAMATTQAPRLDGKKRDEVTGHMPIIDYGPWSRLSEHWFTWQTGKCADHEMDWTLCATRVGSKNAEKVCKQYHDDFIECAYRIKTV